MALPREVYQALEDIVGPENISEEPTVLDSYAFQWEAETHTPQQSKFMPRAEAVLLPGSTEEVQAIVKICNKYRIKYKAYSTGWLFSAAPYHEGVIQLDLRRMDHILKIDEKNMFAVVEPYVVAGTLQAEAMKVGLNCHVIGPGAVASPLAQCTSLWGHGADSIYHGHASEDMLAVEWVMPDGDILRTGSLASGCDWFCSEGPGPSLRGLIRGEWGAAGGMGVFTKCAIKLSPWPGPAIMPVEGRPPAYNSPLPGNFRAYTLAVPSWEAYADLYHKIYDSEIGYVAHNQWHQLGADLSPILFKAIFPDPTKTLNDLEELVKDAELKKLTDEMRFSFQIVLAGQTPNDIEYQEKVLDQILADTGGHRVAAMLEPNVERYALLYLIKHHNKNQYFSYGGSYSVSFTQMGTPDSMVMQNPILVNALRKIQETGLTVKAGADNLMGTVGAAGGGTYCLLEQCCHYDPYNKDSLNAVIAFVKESAKALSKAGWADGMSLFYAQTQPTQELQEQILRQTPQPTAYQWQWRIKHVFDPNNTGDSNYVTLQPPK